MRVTNQMMVRNSISRLQGNLQAMERARSQVSTGLRVQKMSDDPIAAGEVVRTGSSLRAIEQFRRNITIGKGRAEAEERALDGLTNALARATELAIGQSTATATTQSRLAVKAEVDGLIEYVVGLGNTRLGDGYLFAGTRGGEAPFRTPAVAGDYRALLDTGGNPVDPSGSIPLEIGDGRFLTPNHTGTQVFLDTDALATLHELSRALGADDVPGVRATIDRLNGATDDVQALIGRQGARVNELEIAENSLGDLELTLLTYRSDLRDAEIDKAMVELVGKQTLYQAAMSATSRVLGMSLADYL